MTREQAIPLDSQNTRYGAIFSRREPLRLESGEVLPSLEIAYTVLGRLNAGRTNAILVCHALTGNAHASNALLHHGETIPGWFNGVIGPALGIDTDRFFVICSNILGSCYGTTGPASVNPATGEPYRMTFPRITVRDMVRVQKLLLERLGVRRLVTVIGGSLGGMQALEWGVMYPEMVGSLVPIATAAAHSPWCIGISETQRLAIMNDTAWQGGNYSVQPERGLAIARAIAMISYRSQAAFAKRFERKGITTGDGHERVHVFDDIPLSFAVQSYLRYQGQKLADRFDANTYIYLTRAMDTHDLSAGRGSMKEVLGAISARVLSIGISSDILYPPTEQKEIASAIPGAAYAELDSPHGHDAFLIEFDTMNTLLRDFLA
jgi:homoserine O-acetyltransferase